MKQNQNLVAIGQRYTDIVWAAGLFEGEGTIYTDAARPISRYIRMEMTDEDVMERFVNVVGYGNLIGPYHAPCRQPHHKAVWYWKVGKRIEVSRILKMFLPHFGKRRSKKAIEAITTIENIN